MAQKCRFSQGAAVGPQAPWMAAAVAAAAAADRGLAVVRGCQGVRLGAERGCQVRCARRLRFTWAAHQRANLVVVEVVRVQRALAGAEAEAAAAAAAAAGECQLRCCSRCGRRQTRGRAAARHMGQHHRHHHHRQRLLRNLRQGQRQHRRQQERQPPTPMRLRV